MKTALLYSKVFLGNIFRLLVSRHDPKKGYFIVIDGGDGSGKSTVLERLKAKYPQVEFSREPGGTPYAEEIRAVMLNSHYAKDATGRTIFLLVSAGRSDHMDKKAAPTINAGKHFITDRSDSTSWGYQIGGQEGGYDLKKLFFAVRKAVYKDVRPDLHIILNVDPEEGARRVASRKGEVNHFDERKKDFHIRVVKAYKTFARLFPGEVKFVDANKSKDEVFAEVDSIVSSYILKS